MTAEQLSEKTYSLSGSTISYNNKQLPNLVNVLKWQVGLGVHYLGCHAYLLGWIELIPDRELIPRESFYGHILLETGAGHFSPFNSSEIQLGDQYRRQCKEARIKEAFEYLETQMPSSYPFVLCTGNITNLNKDTFFTYKFVKYLVKERDWKLSKSMCAIHHEYKHNVVQTWTLVRPDAEIVTEPEDKWLEPWDKL